MKVSWDLWMGSDTCSGMGAWRHGHETEEPRQHGCTCKGVLKRVQHAKADLKHHECVHQQHFVKHEAKLTIHNSVMWLKQSLADIWTESGGLCSRTSTRNAVVVKLPACDVASKAPCLSNVEQANLRYCRERSPSPTSRRGQLSPTCRGPSSPCRRRLGAAPIEA